MRTPFTARAFIIIFGIVLGLGLQPALADQPNLFVMSEEADDDAVPRKSRVLGVLLQQSKTRWLIKDSPSTTKPWSPWTTMYRADQDDPAQKS